MRKGERFKNTQNRRRVLMRARAEILRQGVLGLAEFAREERLTRADAALHLAQIAYFHRTAERFVGHPIRSDRLVGRVMSRITIDEKFVSYLGALGPRSGVVWAARAYTAILLPRERRSRGQFFTPEPIARAMAEWAIRSKSDRVLDPGTGPGQLLASAYARLRDLGARRPVSQLVGTEVSRLAATFSALALAPRRDALRIDQADFLTAFRARRGSFDAIVANPPYSRHQTLPTAYKEQIGALADELAGARVHRSAGIYVHFLLRSISLLKDGGRLAFLTPREFFDARYGDVVRAHLLSRTRLRALLVFDPAATAAFEGVLTTSAITLLERGIPDREPVRIVHIRTIPSASQLRAALDPEAQPGERSWGWIENVGYEDVSSAKRWSSLLPGHAPGPAALGHVRLGELVQVKRGIATGANRFFVLSRDVADAHGLRNGSLRPAIARAHLVDMERITKKTFERWSADGQRVWLLDIRHKKLTPAERAYLRTGRDQEFDERTLCRMRAPWYRMERRDPPPILVTYMSKAAPRFVRNDARLLPLNVFHGLYPRDLSGQQLDQLFAHLNSDAFRKRIRRAARTYGGGLLKIEPRELAAVTVPDVRQTDLRDPRSRSPDGAARSRPERPPG